MLDQRGVHCGWKPLGWRRLRQVQKRVQWWEGVPAAAAGPPALARSPRGSTTLQGGTAGPAPPARLLVRHHTLAARPGGQGCRPQRRFGPCRPRSLRAPAPAAPAAGPSLHAAWAASAAAPASFSAAEAVQVLGARSSLHPREHLTDSAPLQCPRCACYALHAGGHVCS